MTLSRRHWLTGLAASALVFGTPMCESARRLVTFSAYRPGTSVIITHRRELFFVLGDGRAIR